jgi:hypothetical protein
MGKAAPDRLMSSGVHLHLENHLSKMFPLLGSRRQSL